MQARLQACQARLCVLCCLLPPCTCVANAATLEVHFCYEASTHSTGRSWTGLSSCCRHCQASLQAGPEMGKTVMRASALSSPLHAFWELVAAADPCARKDG